jgi:DNA-3-methyladenine glycosylase I
MSAPLVHADGLKRCPWPKDDPVYVAYHDEEWGVPEFDDRALFEKLLLDGFQAGLSWITILRKRDNFRRAFDGFDRRRSRATRRPGSRSSMQDAGIVRNRLKIEGACSRPAAISTSWRRGRASRRCCGIFSTANPR